MEKNKKLTAEETYKRNQKKAKLFSVLAPICFWGFLALSVLMLILAVRHSFGNMGEIIDLLDSNKFTGEELKTNYAYLIDKYGEWIIGNGGSGFTITFINIGNAIFSGLMIASCVLSVVFLVSAFVLGKWLLPMLSRQILNDNQDMVNLTILKEKDKE